MPSEVQVTIKMMKVNKADSPDKIVIGMIKTVEEYEIRKLIDVINMIFDEGKFLEAPSKSIFIAFLKQSGAVACEQYRTTNLMGHVTKIILRILLLRARSRTTHEIAIEQFAFGKDAGTRNAIFVLRTITERAMEMQNDIFMCFADYTKAFGKVKHDILFQELSNLDLNGKDLQILQDLYRNQ
ncbi:Hypothetical predicted protein [Octopus vulgaris]|uniref:Reverse transcriptase domain-containing protein n=1 Tax=Octopus vulgaris TaxID=6645 RepID=A0AA36APJ8_OCTVU|nr:Hypothetical predicted protein [Octopus vulgaris]